MLGDAEIHVEIRHPHPINEYTTLIRADIEVSTLIYCSILMAWSRLGKGMNSLLWVNLQLVTLFRVVQHAFRSRQGLRGGDQVVILSEFRVILGSHKEPFAAFKLYIRKNTLHKYSDSPFLRPFGILCSWEEKWNS